MGGSTGKSAYKAVRSVLERKQLGQAGSRRSQMGGSGQRRLPPLLPRLKGSRSVRPTRRRRRRRAGIGGAGSLPVGCGPPPPRPGTPGRRRRAQGSRRSAALQLRGGGGYARRRVSCRVAQRGMSRRAHVHARVLQPGHPTWLENAVVAAARLARLRPHKLLPPGVAHGLPGSAPALRRGSDGRGRGGQRGREGAQARKTEHSVRRRPGACTATTRTPGSPAA